MPEHVARLKTTLALEKANAIIAQARHVGEMEGFLPLTIVVLDAGGRLIATQSEDGSGLLRFDVAFAKAWGALGMGMSSRLLRDNLSARPVFQAALATASDGRFIPVPGGVIALDKEGFAIGAVGISGDTSDKDEYCAIKSLQHVGLHSEPADINPEWRNSSLADTPAR